MSQQRILIVDDYDDCRVILRYRLQRLGTFDILEATDGQEALRIVARELLNLIIMNLGLPVLDGWEATRRIRAMAPPARDVPIMAYTAYALPGHEQRARQAGCDEYLTKPVLDPRSFQQAVTRLLARGRTP